MQTKLTLRVEDGLIVRAKVWARRRGVSLSQAVATLLEQLPSAPPEASLAPWTRKLIGIARRGKGRPPSDVAIRRAHIDHLALKHR